jgi:nicotinate-nucleotide pyrophosphorylase (carboxylating)
VSLVDEAVRRLVAAALAEDVGTGDLTAEATVPAAALAVGTLLAKQELVLAGLDVARLVFEVRVGDLQWDVEVSDGASLTPGQSIGKVRGNARGLLSAERVALNFLQRLSGVATITRGFVAAVEGTRARIRDTRKTTPLLRVLEKHAVKVGGGVPHRSGLDTGVLIKDNHIRLAGGAGEATRRAVATWGGRGVEIEVEVERLEQIEEVLSAGAGMILLDNFAPDQVHEAVRAIAGRVRVEVSGGVTLRNVRAYAEAGPDLIAIGALTHSAPAADISLEIEPA